jgi:hypothetical protein
MAGIGESMFARESAPIGDVEKSRIYLTISPAPDKPGCRHRIFSPGAAQMPEFTPSNIKLKT